MEAPGLDGKMHFFEKPVFTSFLAALAVAIILPAYYVYTHVSEWHTKRKRRHAMRTAGVQQALLLAADASAGKPQV